MRAFDGRLYSPYSSYCGFGVETTPPAVAPTVFSADYPEGVVSGGVGIPGTFVFGAAGVADVTHFLWGINVSSPTTPVTAVRPDKSATLEIAPKSAGPNTLTVRSVDRAGNYGPVTSYVFRVASATDFARWPLDDGQRAVA